MQLDIDGRVEHAVTNPVVVAVDFSSLYSSIASKPISTPVKKVQDVTICVGEIETETGIVAILLGTFGVCTTMLDDQGPTPGTF